MELFLKSNEIQKKDDYRQSVFDLIPSLLVLDGCDKNGEEVNFDDGSQNDEGKYKIN